MKTILRMLALLALVLPGLSAPSHAAVTAFFSAGANCSGNNNVSFNPGGAAVKVSLCLTATAEYLCGLSYRFVPASASENNLFQVTARELVAPFSDPNNVVSLPFPITTAAVGDLGATVDTLATCTPPNGTYRVATYDVAPSLATTASAYTINLDPISSVAAASQPTLAFITEVPISASFILRNGASSAPLSQTISLTAPGPQGISSTPIPLIATATSGLPVTFTSLSPAICTVSGTSAVLLAVGVCTIAANQAGNASFNSAPQITVTFTVSAPSPSGVAVLTASANPLPPLIMGRNVTLTALVKMKNPAGTVSFFDGDTPISACAQRPLSVLPDATEAAVATCIFTTPIISAPLPPGVVNRRYVVNYFYPPNHASQRISEQFNLDIPTLTTAQDPLDYTDMWWAGTAENGWGMSITQHGLIQFNVIFAYDSLGKPLWYVMPGGSWNATNTVFTGALYQPTSAPFSAYNKAQFVPGASVGTATITYANSGTANLAYTINGISGTKTIQRQVFATDTGQPRPVVNDLWWAGAQEDGWGMNIAQQGRTLFPVWYTYDSTGKTIFYTVPGGTWDGTIYRGDIYATVSSGWLGVNYTASQFVATKVGTMTLNFADQNNATMTYVVNGISQTKTITRQPF